MGFQFRTRSSSQGSSGNGKPLGFFSKVFYSLFLGVFLGAGIFFLIMIARETTKAVKTRFWTKTPCTIVESGLGDAKDGKTKILHVAYDYKFDGGDHTSSQYQLDYTGSDSVAKAQALARAFPAGRKTQCWVNPKNPSEAVLAHKSPAIAFMVFLPAIFILIGGGGIWGVWFTKPAPSDDPKAPISARARGGKTAGGFFMGIFILAGLAMFIFLTVRPALRVLLARSWNATPCVIESSDVASHSDKDGSTYSVEIVYRYVIGGEEFHNDRYDFMGGSSSGYEGKRAIAAQYPSGSKRQCWVNPRDPADAVLERGFRPVMLIGCIGFIFMGAGLLGARAMRPKTFPGADWRPQSANAARIGASQYSVSQSPSAVPAGSSGPLVLKAKQGPVGCFVFAIIFAGFWNGIVGVFVHQVWTSRNAGNMQWGLTLFLVPFVLVGLAAIGGVVYAFLGLFNPRARATLEPGSPIVGEACKLNYGFTGSAHRIRSLKVTLEGLERATYRRGTDTTTDESIFFQKHLLETTRQSEVRGGSLEFALPEPAMHSFKSAHNEIQWQIRIEGDIPGWPNVKTECVVQVAPKQTGGLAS